MPTSKQITVFLENKPGRLADLLSNLAAAKVNIIALSVMDRHEHGVLRFVTNESDKALEIIRAQNAPITETDVLLVELRNNPGALANVCETLASEHISIDYAYCSSGGRNGKVLGVFKVSNLDKAQKIIAEPPKQTARKKIVRRLVRDQGPNRNR